MLTAKYEVYKHQIHVHFKILGEEKVAMLNF